MKLYYYTSIENLALILKSNKIRFTRLDQVDDVEEALNYQDNVNMSSYTFVSCWSSLAEEIVQI